MNAREQQAAQCGANATRQFYSDARELVVSFARPSFDDAIVAWIKLHLRAEWGSSEPSSALYLLGIQKAFLSLYDAEVLNPIYAITDLGQEYIDQARSATGIGLDALPAPAAPKLSADDILRNQIKQDWVSLPGDRVRQKANQDANYRRLLEEMLNTDAIADPVSSSFYKIDGPDFGSQNSY